MFCQSPSSGFEFAKNLLLSGFCEGNSELGVYYVVGNDYYDSLD